jgi:protein-tyrosine-phosphatase
MTSPLRIVFVCSGNICRSPMAEGLARRELERLGMSGQVISMGTLGIFGRPASEFALQVCSEVDIDLTRHSSQGLSLGLLALSDAVVVMETAHRSMILEQRPALTNLQLLSDYDDLDGPVDVADPIGSDLESYRACFQRLERCVRALVERLVRLKEVTA